MKSSQSVVVATTKVRIFKQITTVTPFLSEGTLLLLLPQRYVFSSKSQPVMKQLGDIAVVVATTKVHIFKQITTTQNHYANGQQLLLLPQRYVFSSKSQLNEVINNKRMELLLLPQRYVFSSKSQHKNVPSFNSRVVVATTKVRILKQITMGFLMLINFKKRFRF